LLRTGALKRSTTLRACALQRTSARTLRAALQRAATRTLLSTLQRTALLLAALLILLLLILIVLKRVRVLGESDSGPREGHCRD